MAGGAEAPRAVEPRPVALDRDRHASSALTAAPRWLPRRARGGRSLVALRAAGSPATLALSGAALRGPPIALRFELPWHQEAALHLEGVSAEALGRAAPELGALAEALLATPRPREARLPLGPPSALSRGAAESDYYDTPSLDLFRWDPSVAQRSKIQFAGRTPKKLEISALTESGPPVAGVETKANLVVVHPNPSPEQAASIDADFRRGAVAWSGVDTPSLPARFLFQRAVALGLVREDGALELRSALHLRSRSVGARLERPSARALGADFERGRAELEAASAHRPELRAAIAALEAARAEGLLPAALGGGVAETLETIEGRERAAAELVRTLGAAAEEAPASIARALQRVSSALSALAFAEAERFHFGLEVPGVELGVKLYDFVDPEAWARLAPEDRHPETALPPQAVQGRSLDLSVELIGGAAPLLARLAELERAVDQARGAVVMRALESRFALGPRPGAHQRVLRAALTGDTGWLSRATGLDRPQLERLADAEVLEPGLLARGGLEVDAAAVDAAERRLAGARAIYGAHQDRLHGLAAALAAGAGGALDGLGLGSGRFVESHASPRERHLGARLAAG